MADPQYQSDAINSGREKTTSRKRVDKEESRSEKFFVPALGHANSNFISSGKSTSVDVNITSDKSDNFCVFHARYAAIPIDSRKKDRHEN